MLFASSLALSSQRSARAGEAASTANNASIARATVRRSAIEALYAGIVMHRPTNETQVRFMQGLADGVNMHRDRRGDHRVVPAINRRAAEIDRLTRHIRRQYVRHLPSWFLETPAACRVQSLP